MPRYTQHPEHTSTSFPNQPICIVAHAKAYATQQIPHRQRPSPVDLHHHACQDIHNTTDTPQSAATGRHHYNLRMPGHTQPPATARGGGTDTGIHASTGTTASPKEKDKRDQSLRPRHPPHHCPSLASSSASATTFFFNPGRLTDSLGLCALDCGSSGPVTSTCAFGKIRCNSGMN